MRANLLRVPAVIGAVQNVLFGHGRKWQLCPPQSAFCGRRRNLSFACAVFVAHGGRLAGVGEERRPRRGNLDRGDDSIVGCMSLLSPLKILAGQARKLGPAHPHLRTLRF